MSGKRYGVPFWVLACHGPAAAWGLRVGDLALIESSDDVENLVSEEENAEVAFEFLSTMVEHIWWDEFLGDKFSGGQAIEGHI